MSGKYWDEPLGWVQGCNPVSPACKHCWLAEYYHRHANNPKMKGQFKGLTKLINGVPTCTGKVITRPDRLDIPLKRKKPTVYAVWSDLFHPDAPFSFVNSAMGIITSSPQHTFLILTKRPQRALDYFNHFKECEIKVDTFISNMWIGVTAENQEQADKRIPILLQIPAANRFVSIEPMLGPVDLLQCNYSGVPKDRYFQPVGACEKEDIITHKCKSTTPNWCTYNYLTHLDAVILGGESGHGARPMHPDWARSVRDQCRAAGVPFFFKQWGEWSPEKVTNNMNRIGLKKAGRLMNGREHNALPWRAKYDT